MDLKLGTGLWTESVIVSNDDDSISRLNVWGNIGIMTYCEVRNTVRDVLCRKLKRTVNEVPCRANCFNWCAEE
jgi:hypothetical protein